ncbi:MAG: DNA repair exonuclease [Clostridiales bacterium]|nr:DNA repair exonuclease [Clostridiales bacterium]
MIKIFHTADLHLDSPFSSFPIAKSEERRVGLRRTFKRMMEYAAREAVDLILISGDLFDCSYISRDTSQILRECFGAVSCPVVISPGNHDPYTPGSIYASGILPENVYIFKTESPFKFDFPELGITVWGAAFTRERYDGSVLAAIPGLPDDRINILCQHGDTRTMLSQYAPLSPRDIAYKGFTYAALGHIHVPPEPVTLGDTTIAYPGCPEGRSFDEPGFGGALLVNIEGKKVKIENIRFAERRYMVEQLDITGAGDDSLVAGKIRELIKSRGYGPETALRIILVGEVALGYKPNTETLAANCAGELDLLEVRERTLPCFDVGYLAEDFSLRGVFYRVLAEKIQEGSEYERQVAAAALRYGLAALDGRPVI